MKIYNQPTTKVLLMQINAQMLVDSGGSLGGETPKDQPGSSFPAPRRL